MTAATPQAKKNKGGAPKGNKNALGSTTNGRPPKYDLEKEAADLLEWAKKPSSTAIYQFTRDKDYLADELDEFADRSVVFALSYKKAKEIVGQNREEYCNAGLMRDRVWERSAPLYHSKLHRFERAEKEFDAQIKSKIDESAKPARDEITKAENENMILKSRLAKLEEQLDNLTKAR